jgi:hypothetical protein
MPSMAARNKSRARRGQPPLPEPRKIDPRLTARLLTTVDGWAAGKTMAEALENYRRKVKKVFEPGVVWAVTPGTMYTSTGIFQLPISVDGLVQPADITEDKDLY